MILYCCQCSLVMLSAGDDADVNCVVGSSVSL